MGNGENNKNKSSDLNGLNKILKEEKSKEQQDNIYGEEDEVDDNNNRYLVEHNEIIEKPNGKVIIYGFLKKQSKYLKLWKTRFFILTNHYLFAFTGIENDADCTMALDLSTILSVEEDKEEKENKKKIFIIKSATINYIFKAENEDIMKRWVLELQKIIKNYENRMVPLV